MRGESMIASTGLLLAAILLTAMGAAAYWTLRVQRETAAQADSARVQGLGDLLSETASLMLAVDEVSTVRRLVADVARTCELTECRILLPDGRIIADAHPSEINLASLPPTWGGDEAGPPVDRSTHELLSWSYPISVRGRGSARLDIEAAPSQPFQRIWEAQTGVATIGAVTLVALLMMYRRIRSRVLAMGVIREALLALDRGEEAPPALTLREDLGPEARAWNQLLADKDELSKQALGERVREVLTSTRSTHPQLEGLCAAMRHGVILVDENLRATYANGAAGVYLLTTTDNIVGANIAEVIADGEATKALQEAVSGATRSWRSIEIRRQGEGTSSVLRLSARPLRQEDSAAAMITIEDVTQQRGADEARNSFITQVTHELRAPLTNIRLSAETAIDDGDADPQVRANCLNVINQEAKRLERVVSDMLSVSEIEAGTLELRRDDVRLVVLFEELEADYRGVAAEKNVTLEFNLPPKLPVIDADRDKLSLALHNLVNNAIKYTRSGGRVVVNADVEGDELRVDVIDNGIGIPEADIERIFQKFYRAKDPRLAEITGSGLGLALAQEVIRLHGGEIEVESQVDKGSTFSMTLPIPPAKKAA
ncbi:MAG: sensor histidine kinase [Planctomycetota bacterium]|jgi:PAS domain S-box-containing protein